MKQSALTTCALLCSLELLAGEPPNDPLRLDAIVEPTAEALDLKLDPDSDRYTGTARIELQFHTETNQFRFHAKAMHVNSATLDGRELTLKPSEADLVVATASEAFKTGPHTLEINFANDYNRSGAGLYKSVYEGRAYLFTSMEAQDARRAFPCWDEPGFKIPWGLTVTIPSTLEAVANMPLAQTKTIGTNKVLEFGRTPPMSSYLVYIAVGPFERTPVAGLAVPGSVITAPGKTALAQLIARESPGILLALERYFDLPYPYPKLDQIATPEFSWGGMENPGAISYIDSDVLLDAEHVSYNQRRRLMKVLTHEMSHMWFGDLVTMKWWDDLWLNESFASWIEAKVAGPIHPELHFEVMAFQTALEARGADARPSVKPIRRAFGGGANPIEAFDALSYNKGQAILRMVEGWLGPDKFRASLHQYVLRHRWGNARAEDLWAAFDQEAGGNIGETLRGFIEQPGLPQLSFARLSGGRCEVHQSRYQTITSKASPAQTWRVPVVLRYGDKTGVHTARILVTNSQAVIKIAGLEQAEWLYPNAGESGYYECSLSPNLVAGLTNHNKALTTVERLGLLSSAGSAVASGQLSPVQSIQLALSLVADRDPEVQQSAVGSIRGVKNVYLRPEDRPALARFLHNALRPLLDQLGFEPKVGELPQVGPLRASLLMSLGIDGNDKDVITFCGEQARHQLTDPRSADPGIADAVFRVAAWNGDAVLFSALQRAFEQAQAPDVRSRFRGALSGFQDPKLILASLDYCLTDAMNSTEFEYILLGSSRPETASLVFDWLAAQFDKYRKKLPDDSFPYLAYVLSASDADLLAKGRAFFLDPSRKTPVLEVELTKVTEDVELRLALRGRYAESMRKMVRELAAEPLP